MTLGFNPIIAPEPVKVSVQSQSVANALSIMGSLSRIGGDERHIGINEWVDRVRLQLTDEQIEQVTVVMFGLGVEGLLNAVRDPDARDDFELYLNALEQIPAERLRDVCLYWLLNSPHRMVFMDSEPFKSVEVEALLTSRDNFKRYLTDHIEKDVFHQYFDQVAELYFNPEHLKSLTIHLLRELWQGYFKTEWARHQPEIDRVVAAFAQVDVSSMATFDAIQVVTGRDLRPVFRAEMLSKFKQLVFVPSKHNGPYVMWFGDETSLYVVFTAQMPSSALMASGEQPNLNVLIQRFKALSDENRMQVLLAIREQGELSTQDIIEQFDLNKSAASRYLGQLLANGFIVERRDSDGKTKYYSINPNVIDTFLSSIATLLKV